MGSFNVTCSISNFSIECGTKMRAVLLASRKEDGGLGMIFGPSAVFLPISTAVKGEYADYGTMDNVAASPCFLASVAHYLPNYQGSEEEILAEIVENAVSGHGDDSANQTTIAGYRPIKAQVEVAYIREDVWQALLNIQVKGWEMKLSRGLAVTDASVKSDIEIIAKVIDKDVSLYSGLKSAADKLRAEGKINEAEDIEKLLPNDQSASLQGAFMMAGRSQLQHFAALAYSSETDDIAAGLQPISQLLVKAIQQDKDAPETLALAKEIAEFLHVQKMMRVLNILWQPHTNMCGQEPNWDIHAAWQKELTAIARKEHKAEIAASKEWDDEPTPPPTPPAPRGPA